MSGQMWNQRILQTRLLFFFSHAHISVLDFIFLYVRLFPVRWHFLLTKMGKQGRCNISNKAAHFPFEEKFFFKNKLYDRCK